MGDPLSLEAVEPRPYARINHPSRSAGERDHLRRELARGAVDFIGSDHAPYPRGGTRPGRGGLSGDDGAPDDRCGAQGAP